MPPPPPPHGQPRLEPLEDRSLPATGITAALSGGVLSIQGTSGNDTIIVRQINNQLSIDNVRIQYGTTSYASLPTSNVQKIEVRGLDGNDRIYLNSGNNPSQQAITKPTEAWTGNGADIIWGADGPCTLHGGAGPDTLYAGAGADVLYAGTGNASLVGGAGHDTLIGGPGNDTLIGNSGSDVLKGGAGFNTYHEKFTPSAPFFRGESVSDIRQDLSPTCQTLAALAAGVRAGIDFSKQITYIGGTSYVVSVMKGNQITHQTVQFNGTWTDNDPQPALNEYGWVVPEFWTILMQRARLQSLGINYSQPMTQAQWDQADANTGYLLYSVGNAIYSLTGQRTQMSFVSSTTPQSLQTILNRSTGMAVASTYSDASRLTPSAGLIADHAYTLLKVYLESGVWNLQIYNPAGRNGGLSTITWSVFAQSFQYVNTAG